VAERLKIADSDFDGVDLHVHVPSGAVPKDGPSAGVVMAAAIASLFTQRPVKPQVAMTGEITLRGLLLPIGGLKEKALGAYRAGIKTIVLPETNRKDLYDLPEELREKLDFEFVKTIDEALDFALVIPRAAKRGTKVKSKSISMRRRKK
jgi:ATP-dependent Lon protease